MGSGGSKEVSEASSSRRGGGGRWGQRVFQSSCLGAPSGSRGIDCEDQVCDHQKKLSGGNNALCASQTEVESDEVKIKCCRKVKIEKSDEMPCISSNVEPDAWGQARITETSGSGVSGNSTHFSSNQSADSSNRFLSRFSLIPGNISFRLSRATSMGSSRSYPVSSASVSILNDGEEISLPSGPCRGLTNRIGAQHGTDLLPAHLSSRTSGQCCEGTSWNQLSTPSNLSDNLWDASAPSSVHVALESDSSRTDADVNIHSSRICTESERVETRHPDRRIGYREPVERNFRFSRTLSVGRLRDRVLRRSSLSDISYSPSQQENSARDTAQCSRRQAWDDGIGTSPSQGDALSSSSTPSYPPSNVPGALFGIEDYEVESGRSRESRYHDLMEHRSNFLERRRRIRSQVRALQRLGSRFENLSGHDRSCILSGQHRMGRCMCHSSNRETNSSDDTSTRASISRIVMLAEALFEVLDEIHQQSVVLSSRPSISSIGSVPAPNEVVESLPVKLYIKSQKYQSEEAAQCYICLVEYEEGDSMRILPCHHEFHRTCIDKWLKEIHRVCPLCRGDICRSN